MLSNYTKIAILNFDTIRQILYKMAMRMSKMSQRSYHLVTINVTLFIINFYGIF